MFPCPQSQLYFNKEQMVFEVKDTSLYFSHITINDFDEKHPQRQATLYELTLSDTSQKSNICDLYANNSAFEIKGDINSVKSKKDLRFTIYCSKNDNSHGRRFIFCLHECQEKNSIIKSGCP
jgi:hypothetical protein